MIEDSETSIWRSRVRPITSHLASIFFLDPDPRRMRRIQLHPGEAAQAGRLRPLLRSAPPDRGRREKDEDPRIIRALPEQDISDITYLETPRGEVMLELHETFGGKVVPIEAALLSDGTLRVLAVAAALFSIPEDVRSSSSRRSTTASIRAGPRSSSWISRGSPVSAELLQVLLDDPQSRPAGCSSPRSRSRHRRLLPRPRGGGQPAHASGGAGSYPELVAQGPLGRLVTRESWTAI